MISVCVAAYNGARYIECQLASILTQLDPTDEVIVVDDCSTDDTVDVITGMRDSRITVISAPRNNGYVRTFEAAMRASRGDVVFLADQDDYWLPGHVSSMVECLRRRGAGLVAGNLRTTAVQGVEGPPGELLRLPRMARARNLVGIFRGSVPYFGSAMACDRAFLEAVLPFPSYVRTHDLYFALIANLTGTIAHCDQVVTLRTITGHNLSARRRSLAARVATRVWFARACLRGVRLALRCRRPSMPSHD